MTAADGARITPELASRLVAAQFPRWANLPVVPIADNGRHNTIFRLGADMSVRLPNDAHGALQVGKEHRWLPALAAGLPLPIPEPLARGRPGCGFPRPWSVCRWRDGERATIERIADLARFATDLAEFLVALRGVDPSGGSPPGDHNFRRGGPLAFYDAETRDAIGALRGDIDAGAATDAWEAALAAAWHGRPVWVHGDVSAANLLVADGRLRAVLDFGCCGVGDPACDLVIAWTFLADESREAFRARIAVDEATWARGRGWALWKAMTTIVEARAAGPGDPEFAERRQGWRHAARHVVDDVLAEHRHRPR